MAKFAQGKLQRGQVRLAQTLAPDASALSVILEGASVTNDSADPAGVIESNTIELVIPYSGAPKQALLAMDIRGALELSSNNCWGLIFINSAGRRMTISSTEQAGAIYGRYVVPIKTKGNIHISLSLLALRDPADEQSFVSAEIDSLDFSFVSP